MILTYKVKHNRDFSEELKKARLVAEYSLRHRTFSSKDVKHIGLKSTICNQILRKYGRAKNIKKVRSVKLTVPNQGIKVNKPDRTIYIPCLKLMFEYKFPVDFEKVNQIEIGEKYIYVSITVKEKKMKQVDKYIGVDLNVTGHVAVVTNPETGKVWKLGKQTEHIHKKYKNIRRNLQKHDKYKKVKEIGDREKRVIRDLNHKISRKIIDIAERNNCGIKLEKLGGIRNNKRYSRSFRYSLNSWSFYQLQKMIEYKAKLSGIPVIYVDSAYTSKLCSKCGQTGNRNGKEFKCSYCGHVDHADVNASFNIALRQEA